ncbi:MAG: murein biosynthesis integral membrane protein MurJ [Actinomycetota bacterium]
MTEPDAERTPEAPGPDPGRRALARSSALVATGTLLSRLTGLGRILTLAWALGGASLADVYNLANVTPNVIYELLTGGILTAAIVPLFVRQMLDDDERGTSAVVTVTLGAVAALTAATLLLTPFIAWIFTIGTTGADRAAQREVLTVLLACFVPQIFFYALSTLLTSLLNAHRRFVAAAYAPVANNVVVIGVLIAFGLATGGEPGWADASRARGATGMLLLLGLGTTAGVATTALLLVPALRGTHVRIRAVFDWRNPGVRTIARLSGWTLGYVAANQVAQIFVLVLAKSGSPGDVTAYVYAFTFYVLPHSLLAVSLMTTLAPEFARRSATGDLPGLRRDFALGLRYLVVLTVPAAAAFVVLAHPMLGVLQIGRFGAASATTTAETLRLFAPSLLPFSVYLYAMRAFYAHEGTRTPFFLNLGENVVNIVLALALFPAFGIRGLAAAWSIAYTLAAVAAVIVLRARIGSGLGAGVGGAATRTALGTVALVAVAAPVAGLIGRETPTRAFAAVAVAGSLGAVAFAAVLAATGSVELREMRRLVGRSRRRASGVSR